MPAKQLRELSSPWRGAGANPFLLRQAARRHTGRRPRQPAVHLQTGTDRGSTRASPYGSNLTYPLDRYTRFCQTSATTTGTSHALAGHARELGLDDRQLDARLPRRPASARGSHLLRLLLRTVPRILGRDSRPPPAWAASPFPAAACAAPRACAPSSRPSATVLCCTPTYAIRLAEVAAEENIDLAAAQVATLIVAGEPGGSVPATARPHLETLARRARRGPSRHDRDRPSQLRLPEASPACCTSSETSYIAEVIDPVTGATRTPRSHRRVSPDEPRPPGIAADPLSHQ